MKETLMYQAVRSFLEGQGYAVRSEVKDCDLVAVKDGQVTVLEFKRAFGIPILKQAVERQKAVDSVYVVLPKPKPFVMSKSWRSTCHLLRRLELGLLLVDLHSVPQKVHVMFHPTPVSYRRKKHVERAILKEAAGRSDDYNVAGSCRVKLVTAYRELSVKTACYLQVFGPMAPKDLKSMDFEAKVGSILSDNFYGWFSRVRRGVYRLSAKGEADIREYPELYERYIGQARYEKPTQDGV